MKCYKLTDESGKTHGGCQWGPGVTRTAPGNGALCSRAYIHGYENKLIAVLMNPVHGGFTKPRMWEAEANGEIKRDGQLKFGCTEMTTIREIPIPEMTDGQRVRVAILCVKQVCSNPRWNKWADAWLSGKDRSSASATAAAWETEAESSAAAWAAEAASSAAALASSVAATAASRAALAADAASAASAPYSGKSVPDLARIIESVTGRLP